MLLRNLNNYFLSDIPLITWRGNTGLISFAAFETFFLINQNAERHLLIISINGTGKCGHETIGKKREKLKKREHICLFPEYHWWISVNKRGNLLSLWARTYLGNQQQKKKAKKKLVLKWQAACSVAIINISLSVTLSAGTAWVDLHLTLDLPLPSPCDCRGDRERGRLGKGMGFKSPQGSVLSQRRLCDREFWFIIGETRALTHKTLL